MVACIIAFFVFSFLAIFSAKYRQLAKEAFRCVFLKLTFRPCEAKLDEKIKATVIASILEKSPGTAKFVNKHFEAISLVFTILMFASFAYLLYGAYNYVTLGTCDPVNPANCILTQLTNATVNQTAPYQCTIKADFAEFYGEECPHCKKMAPILAEVEQETGVTFEKFEVWHNQDNQLLMQKHADIFERDCGFMGVPTFYSVKSKKAVCGEMTKEQLKKFVLDNK